ncbi:galactosyl transferase GMA12/MNN10 family-domain-containing protein [Dipodascopsis tothii]|uniref:galactosyl transferase GMA12/MNN10 family-domain-containing protein n=1 Tax=Dipodascopsis tothii TaxID=44089 RepID=UPI0034CE6525
MVIRYSQIVIFLTALGALTVILLTIFSADEAVTRATDVVVETAPKGVEGAAIQVGPVSSTEQAKIEDVDKAAEAAGKAAAEKAAADKAAADKAAADKPADKPAEKPADKPADKAAKPKYDVDKDDVEEEEVGDVADDAADIAVAPTTASKAFAGLAKDTVEPLGKKIALLTASDGRGNNAAIEGLFDMVTQNRQEYCDYHGYTHQFINITKYNLNGRPAVWSKLPAISETFELNPEVEWVWWLDMDAIIMTPEIDLATHVLSLKALSERVTFGKALRYPNGKESPVVVSEKYDVAGTNFVVAQDINGVNAGSFMVRRSEWSKWFLDLWGDPLFYERKFERQEQDVLNHLILHHANIRDHVAVVSQRVINAFSVGGRDMGWKTGDLTVHFAGCWVDNACNQRWKDFWSRRKTVADVLAEKDAKAATGSA